MGRALRSGKVVASPKAKQSPKRRVGSIDQDFTPNVNGARERVYHPPTDPTYRPGKSPTSPAASQVKSYVSKPKSNKPQKPAEALRRAVRYLDKNSASISKPSNMTKSRTGSSFSSKSSPSKSVRFSKSEGEGREVPQVDGAYDMYSDGTQQYHLPLSYVFKENDVIPKEKGVAGINGRPGRIVSSSSSSRPLSSRFKKPPRSPKKADDSSAIEWLEVSDAANSLLNSLLETPHKISLNDISACFYHLQLRTRVWSKLHFEYSLCDDEKFIEALREAWPLHLLKTKYLPLMTTTQYIADGSQYGWRRFFTNPESRHCLVYGIVGEYLKHHLFGHTAFGFTEEENAEIEKLDRIHLHHDAFLRNPEKAKVLKRFFATMPQTKRMEVVRRQANDLIDQIFEIIEPLMPSPVFEYSLDKKRWHAPDDEASEAAQDKIREQLLPTILQCVALHWAIRLRGEDGVVVKFANHAQKGEQYHETAPFAIINGSMINETRHHGRQGGKDGLIKIKLTCWGRVEAYVPQGPHHLKLVALEDEYRARNGIADDEEVDWLDIDAWHFTNTMEFPLPPQPEEVVWRSSRDRGVQLEGDEEWHGAYVSSHRVICNHEVYCEWEPLGKQAFNFNTAPRVEEIQENRRLPKWWQTSREDSADRRYGTPIPKSERLSLQEAVEEARRQTHTIRHKCEDASLAMWKHVMNDHWGKYETLAAISLALFLGVGAMRLCRRVDWKHISPAKVMRMLEWVKRKGSRMADVPRELEDMGVTSAAGARELARKMREDGVVRGWLRYWGDREMQKIRGLTKVVDDIAVEVANIGKGKAKLPAGSAHTTSH